MFEAMNTGCYGQVPWQGPVVTFGHRSGFGLLLIGAAAAWREVLYFHSQIKCAAAAAYCISVERCRISEAGVFVIVSGFFGAKGMSGQFSVASAWLVTVVLACTTPEDYSPRQAVASLKDTLFLSLLVKTHMTLCCGSHPLGPTVDRHSSVNSGARYAEDYVVTVFGLHLGGRRPSFCVRDSARPRPPSEAQAGDADAVHHVALRG